MKSVEALANKAYTSILGALGSGASGSVSDNYLSQTNAAPVAPGTTATWGSSAFVSRTGRVEISAQMTLSKNGGTLAAGDVVTFTLLRDATPIGGQSRDSALANGADAIANGNLVWVDTSVPGASHTYAIVATITGGHTGGILTHEATIVVQDI
jgi:hypothetical protein